MPDTQSVLTGMPVWVQLTAVFMVPIGTIGGIATTFLLKDRYQLKSEKRKQDAADKSGEAALVTATNAGQASAMTSVVQAANMVPGLMKELRDLMDAHKALIVDNGRLTARVEVLSSEVERLSKEVAALRDERDSWKEQAQQVPVLIGQMTAYKDVGTRLEGEKQSLLGQVGALQRRLAECEGVVMNRRAGDPGHAEVVNIDS